PERLKQSRLYVERAVKQRKIFMLHGPYPVIRRLLRSRGWVEKKAPKAAHRWERVPEGEDGEGDDSDRVEEELPDESSVFRPGQSMGLGRGTFRLGQSAGSRLVRNQMPYFIWTNRRDAIDCRFLRKEQVMNHYAKVGSFTTKVGLCLNLRNLPWFDQANADTFFPRCYRLGAEDEKHAFIGERCCVLGGTLPQGGAAPSWPRGGRGLSWVMGGHPAGPRGGQGLSRLMRGLPAGPERGRGLSQVMEGLPAGPRRVQGLSRLMGGLPVGPGRG
uniref:Tubulin tyrosine ligase like 3 n=1 Tax=Chelonoidis abingdonii TaxID=106734 RepID=A0A8C0IKF3_CHEAB